LKHSSSPFSASPPRPIIAAKAEPTGSIVVTGRGVQIIVLVGVIAAGAYAVISNADNWADYVVLGVIVLTTIGAAIAIYPRQYPTAKRAVSRSSEERR
jgi:hypothetical protein